MRALEATMSGMTEATRAAGGAYWLGGPRLNLELPDVMER